MKYDMAISLDSNQIIWIGVDIGGNLFHDLSLARLGILREIGELYLVGDKAYSGEERIITPIKGPTASLSPAQNQYNRNLARIRIAVENVFGRFTNFACMTHPWRGSYSEHTIVFRVLAEMVNIDMCFHPVRRY
jgi:hypothetical protein